MAGPKAAGIGPFHSLGRWMRSYLDFEKPVADLQGKVQELKALGDQGDAVTVNDEIVAWNRGPNRRSATSRRPLRVSRATCRRCPSGAVAGNSGRPTSS